MSSAFANLSSVQINRLFPFYFVIDSSLTIQEFGRSLDKIAIFDNQKSFSQHFRLLRPKLPDVTFETLFSLQNQLLVLQLVNQKGIKIRGQFEFLEAKEQFLFVGSPWFNDIDELRDARLSLSDFALFDPLADLLQVVKNQQLATDDIKMLLSKIKQQKQALENSTKELQNSQTRLQLLSTIAEKTINGVVITDRQGYIEWVNDSFTHITGFVLEEVIGKKPGQVLQGLKSEPKTIEYLSNQIKNGQAFSCEILNYHKNGEQYWIKIMGNPITDAAGQVVGFFALEEDITKRILTEQALRDAKEKSDAIAHSKNLFLTNMSHEMRTPLNAILGMGQQLLKTPLNKQQSFFLDSMRGAAEHLLVVINDILDISRIEAGKLYLESIDFDLRVLISRCFNVLSPKAEEKGLIFKAFIDNDVSDYLVGDPHRINQVLLNLLGNALKFTEQGSVRLYVSCITEKKDSQLLRFSIEDTGVGIDEQFINQLFTEFSQEDTSIARKYGGTGLGLNITKKLVNLMNGSIGVSSRKNAGTIFSIDLLLPKGQAQNVHVEEEKDIDPIILKDKSILLVEDNEMNRVLARTILETYEVRLVEVENGAKAVDYLRKRPVNLILMDIQMPIMDGMAATQHIRNDLRLATPILALTANALKGERERCLAGGMDEYISKPFKEKDLINKICKLLDTQIKTKTIDNMPSHPQKPLDMNGTAYEKKSYSFKYLNETSGNNTKFVNDMIDIFKNEAHRILNQLPHDFEKHDFDAIRALAHRFKSNLAMMESTKAARIAQTIESLKEDDANKFKGLLDRLSIETVKILDELSADGY